MVANVTVNSNADARNKILAKIVVGSLASLNNVRTGAYALGFRKIKQLRNMYGYVFQEIRIACFKPKIGRKLSVVLMGQLVTNLIMSPTSGPTTSVRGTDYRALPDNTALLPEVDSLTKIPPAAFYFLPIHKHGTYHVRITNKNEMDCDGNMPNDLNGPDATGNWQFYIK